MENLKKDDLILINFYDPEKKANIEVKAKFIRFNGEKTKINCLVRGRMHWAQADSFISMAEKLDFSNANFNQDVSGWKPVDKKVEKVKKESEPEKENDIISINKKSSKLFEIISKNGKISIDDLSDKSGLMPEQIKSALFSLVRKGILIAFVDGEKISYQCKKKEVTKKVKEVKTKKIEETVSMPDRIFNLSKTGKSFAEIAEQLGVSEMYAREIITIRSGKFKEPKEGTLKHKIYTEIKAGTPPKEIVEKTGTSTVYIHKIKRAMINANII